MAVKQFEDRITPSGPSITTLASFGSGVAVQPTSGLTMDNSGDFYGTAFGNASDYIYDWNQTIGINPIASIASNEGLPLGGLILDNSGNLYGTTNSLNGLFGSIVFERPAGANTTRMLAAFNSGLSANSGLVMDSNGNVYGTALGNAPFTDGAVFEVPQGGGPIKTLFTFDGADGSGPVGGLIMDRSGDLFGVTSAGGANGYGTVFELQNTPKGYTLNTLVTFDNTHGADPEAGLIMDGSGNLYGTTYSGGGGPLSGNGTVFELANNGSNYTFKLLANFQGAIAQNPETSLVMDSNGDLFGGSAVGGNLGDGAIFELVQGQNTITTLDSFNGPGSTGNPGNGTFAEDGLVMDRSGNLYGTTPDGGVNFNGTIFQVAGVGCVP